MREWLPALFLGVIIVCAALAMVGLAVSAWQWIVSLGREPREHIPRHDRRTQLCRVLAIPDTAVRLWVRPDDGSRPWTWLLIAVQPEIAESVDQVIDRQGAPLETLILPVGEVPEKALSR